MVWNRLVISIYYFIIFVYLMFLTFTISFNTGDIATMYRDLGKCIMSYFFFNSCITFVYLAHVSKTVFGKFSKFIRIRDIGIVISNKDNETNEMGKKD